MITMAHITMEIMNQLNSFVTVSSVLELTD